MADNTLGVTTQKNTPAQPSNMGVTSQATNIAQATETGVQNAKANNSTDSSVNMDTSKENVVGLNNQINTLFQKQNYDFMKNGTVATAITPPNVSTAIQNENTSATAANTAESSQLANVTAATKEAEATKAEGASTQISAEEQYANDRAALLNSQVAQMQANDAAYASEQQRKKDVATATLQPLVDSSNALQKGLAEQQLAKAAEDENNLILQNKANEITANLAMSKLGLTHSTAAINTATSIAMQGSLAIAKLQTDNRVAYAKIQNEAAKVIFDNQSAINKITDDANSAVITRKDESLTKITDIQNNILLTEKDKVTAINKVKDEYAAFKLKSEQSLYESLQTNNKNIQTRLEGITKNLEKDKTNAKDEINTSVTSGQWDKLSTTKKQELATRAGMTLGEIEGVKTTTIYSAVNAGLQAAIGKDGIVSPASAKLIYDAASAYIAMGMAPNVAIQKAIAANLNSLPEYALSQKKLTTAQQQAEANLAQTKSTTILNEAKTSMDLAKGQLDLKKATQDLITAKNAWTTTSTPDSEGYVIQSNKDTGATRKVKPEVFKTPSEWSTTKGVELTKAPDGTVIPSRLGVNAAPNGGKQCGEYANDTTGSIPVGQTIAEREKAFTDKVPKVGAQVLFTGSGYDKQYGHVAVVTALNGDGTMTVKQSNRFGDGAITTEVIPISAATGFYNNTPLATQASTAGAKTNIDEMTMKGKPNDIAGAAIAKAGVDITKSGMNMTELQTAVAGAIKGATSPAEGERLANEYLEKIGALPPSLDTNDITGSITKLNTSKLSMAEIKSALENGLKIKPSSSWNSWGEEYYEEDAKGNIKVYKSEALGDKLIGTIDK